MIWPVMKRNKLSLTGLLVAAIVGGFVPAVKSELESGVFDEISSIIRDDAHAPVDSWSVLVSRPLERFKSDLSESQQTDATKGVARDLVRGATFGIALGAYGALLLLALLIALASAAMISRIRRDVFTELRTHAMGVSLATEPSAMPVFSNSAGHLAAGIQQGAVNVAGSYEYLLEAAQLVFSLGATLIAIATKSYLAAAVCLVTVGAMTLLSRTQARRLRSRRQEYDRSRNALVASTDDILSKRELIVSFEQQARYQTKLDEKAKGYASLERALAVWEQFYSALKQLLGDVGRLLVLLGAVAMVFWAGSGSFSGIGDAYFLVAIFARLLSPAEQLVSRYDNMKRSEATSETFVRLLGAEIQAPATRALGSPNQPLSREAGIEFLDVSFRYRPDAPPVLAGCSFSAPARKTTLIVGPSGCGKSSLVKALLGFWPVEAGRIGIHGRDVALSTPEEVRALASYLAQDENVVDETVRENLNWGGLGNPPSDADMQAALDALGLNEVTGSAPLLGRRAKDCSLGQQQRIALARVLIDPSPVAILDEPLAGVDVFTLRSIAPALRQFLQYSGRTVLLVSHRLAFSSWADRVVVLSANGQVEEEGSPADLIRRDGPFATLLATEHEMLFSLASSEHSTPQPTAAATPPSAGG
jgi:ABC-type multidrug transport system fused ATPase/permease subunit